MLFHNLTPTNAVDLSGYEDAFAHVFEHDDLKNIAISGSYGSGKSSVLRSYEKEHPEYRFKYVTLSYFMPTANGITKNNVSTADKCHSQSLNLDLERKIVNQLIHQVDPDNIPLSKFEIKKEFSGNKIFLKTISVIYVIFFSLSQIFPTWFYERLSAIFPKFIEGYYTWLPGFLTLCYITILGIWLYQILCKNSFNFTLNKISIQGADVELENKSKQENSSYFDKHLPEVVYLFERCGADVIVFEDIDRFDTNYIFKRLRELNASVNNARKYYASRNSEFRPLRFFYLLRDDIFDSKDRTKFFDFIIPIVPIITPDNSYAQLLKKAEEGALPGELDRAFLADLSLYIDDMRLFENILNEFNLYNRRLSTSKLKLKYDKLLGIIIYKNIFPKDFSEFQFGRGFVSHVFKQKDVLAAQASEAIRNELNMLREKIEESNREHLGNIYELNMLYIDYLPIISAIALYKSQYTLKKNQ